MIELSRPSTASVHFALQNELKNTSPSSGVLKLEVSLAGVRTDTDFLSVVASAMKFPDYFGNNWDALDECLMDLEWLPADGYWLVIRDSSEVWSQSPCVLGRLVAVWLDASKHWMLRRTPFHLVFVI